MQVWEAASRSNAGVPMRVSCKQCRLWSLTPMSSLEPHPPTLRGYGNGECTGNVTVLVQCHDCTISFFDLALCQPVWLLCSEDGRLNWVPRTLRQQNKLHPNQITYGDETGSPEGKATVGHPWNLWQVAHLWSPKLIVIRIIMNQNPVSFEGKCGDPMDNLWLRITYGQFMI